MYTEFMEEADIPAGPRPRRPGDDRTRSGGPAGGALAEDGGRLAGETERRQSRGYFTSSPAASASPCPRRSARGASGGGRRGLSRHRAGQQESHDHREDAGQLHWGRGRALRPSPAELLLVTLHARHFRIGFDEGPVLIGTLRDTNSPGDLPVALPIGAFLGDPWIIRCWLDVPLRVNGP